MEDLHTRLAEVSPPESLLTRIYYATKDGMPFAVYNLLNSRRRDKANCLINQKILGADGHHCTPLIIAAYYGHDNVVNMLLNKFKPNLEEEGTVKFEECIVKGATALWCAAAAGYLAVVKTLVKAGADVNHTTEQNSTPLRAACFIGRLDIVKYLIEHNADVNISNYINNTCLMLAAHKGYFDLVLLLLERGAKQNAKANCSATALHFAAEGGHADIVLKLLQYGTNITKDVSGMTPLLAAAKCAKEAVVECLIECAEVSKEETIDAYELLGAAYVNTANKNDDFLKVAYKYLWKAMKLRFSDPDNIIHKKLGETVKAYDHWKECETLQELKSIENNQNAIHMEALAIQERILGKHNPDVAYHIIFRGAIFADNGRFDRSIDLWFYALYLQQLNNVSVANDLLRFAQVFAQMIHIGVNLEFSQLLNVLEASVTELTRNKSKINNPDSKKDIKKHIEEMESNITSTLYMLSILTKLLNLNKSGYTEQEKKKAYYQVHKLCALQLHLSDGQTLLHLAVNEKTPVDGFYIHRICKFPCATTTKLLVFCGADVNAMDNKRNTPLHTIVRYRRSAIDVITFGSIIHELVDAGAHVDIVNNIGMTPYDANNIGEAQQILKIQAEMSLKCIAARVIKTYNLPYLKKVPRSLERFIELHGPILHST